MAYSSEHGGIIRGMPTLTVNDPVDTAVTRDGIVNGLNHCSDQFGQVLVQRTPLAAVSLANPSTTIYRRLIDARNVALRVAPCGASYLVVPYLRASISAAGTATFLVMLSYGDFDNPRAGAFPDWQKVITTTSTTAVDLAPGGMFFTPHIMRTRRGDVASHDGGGAPMAAPVFTCAIQVWAKTSLVSSVPRYHAFSAREYWQNV